MNYLSTKLSLPIVVSFCLIITFVVIFLIVNYAFKIKFLDKAYNEKTLFNSKNIIQSVLLSTMSFFLFYILLAIICFIINSSLISIWLIEQYLLIAAIGTVAIAFKCYFLGIVYYFSSLSGYVINCIILLFQQNKPTMLGGIFNGLLIIIGLVVGIIIEIIIRRKCSKKNIQKNNL